MRAGTVQQQRSQGSQGSRGSGGSPDAQGAAQRAATIAQKAGKPRKERKENADRRRRQLLDATRRSIVAHGLARTTLATVAAEAGLSQGVAVFYFASKTGLLTETMRDMYRSYEENWQAALRQAAEDPRAQLVALITADFDPRVCSPEILSVWFAFWGEQSFTPQYREIARAFDASRTEAIESACRALLPGEPQRALKLAQWVDTLTDGYWQHLHLYAGEYQPADMRDEAIGFLRAFLPEHFADL